MTDVASTAFGSAACLGGRSPPSSGWPCSGTPASRAIAATVSGRSPESTSSSTPCASRYSTVSRARPQPLADHDDPERVQVGRRALLRSNVAEVGRRRADRDHAPTPGRLRLGTLLQPVEREELRRAEDVPVAHRSRARSSGGSTRTAPRPRDARLDRERRANRIECRGAARRARRRSGRARSRARPSSPPAAVTASSTFGSGSVSVPVLSVQTMSTEASDSSAFSCWTSAPRRAMRSAATAKVRLVSRIRPSGTSVTTAATAVGDGVAQLRVPVVERVAEQRGRAGRSRRRG